MMNLVAREHLQKGTLFPFVSWKIDSATSFGDYLVEFDLRGERVFRSTAESKHEIARIHAGHKGSTLRDFRGTIESDAFIVTKRSQDWLSSSMVYEITLKETGKTYSHLSILNDTFNPLKLGDLVELKLANDDRAHLFRMKVEGSCTDNHRDLAEILASLILHHNEQDVGSS